MIVDPADKSGRLMIRAADGKGDYILSAEGIDNDGDGRVNEDGIGGLDLHRNYVENWRPMPGLDFTGRGWTQGGSGEYPLSETETRAVVMFLLEHPNVSIGQTMDTSVPMLLHGPSTSRMDESMFPEDLKIYRYFDEEGKKITGYARAGDTYFDYADSAAASGAAGHARRRDAGRSRQEPQPPRGSPIFGHSPDFGYLYYGSVWYGDELWNGGRLKDYDGDGRVTPTRTAPVHRRGAGRQVLHALAQVQPSPARRSRDRRLQSQVLEPEPASRAPRGMDQEGSPVQSLSLQIPAPGEDRRRGRSSRSRKAEEPSRS